MNMQALDIAKWTPEKFEESRNFLIKKYEDVSNKVSAADSKIATANNVVDTYEKNMCDENIAALDVLAFVQIEVFDNDIENYLFGEISKIIEEAVNEEIDEMVNASSEKDFKRQITPSRLIKSCEIEKERIFSNDITKELGNEASITIRCMEIYNEMCQDIESISERSQKKVEENQQLLYLISSKYRFQENVSENHINENALYTIALVSNIKDGSKPSLSDYKSKIVENLNKGINSLVSSTNIKTSIQVFDTARMSLEDCKNYLNDINTPVAKNAKLTIEAVQDIYQERVSEINKLYENVLE